jgi:hypothetical protein
MKNPTLFTVLLILLMAATSVAQTTRRVNNNEGVTGTNVYATIQEAHDAAVNGDIILVEPSLTSYGNLKCSKNLKIYGNGYWLDKNGGISKADINPTRLGDVEFVPGSAGSVMSGLETGNISVFAESNITITGNQCAWFWLYVKYTPSVGPAQYSDIEDVVFSQNYAGDIYVEGELVTATTYKVYNFSMTNNYVKSIYADDYVGNGVIKYNTVSASRIELSNLIFENNIVISNSTEQFDVSDPLTGSFTAAGASINYNVTSANLFPGSLGTGNQNGLDLSAHFITATDDTSDDAKYKLRNDSSLKTAGSGNTEVGMYGGPTPYEVSGIPPVPAITNLKTTGTGSETVPITVTFSAQSY